MNLIKHTILATLAHGTCTARELGVAVRKHQVINNAVVQSVNELLAQGAIRRVAGSDKFVIVGKY